MKFGRRKNETYVKIIPRSTSEALEFFRQVRFLPDFDPDRAACAWCGEKWWEITEISQETIKNWWFHSKVFKITASFVLGGVIITIAYLLVVGVGFAIAHQNYWADHRETVILVICLIHASVQQCTRHALHRSGYSMGTAGVHVSSLLATCVRDPHARDVAS